VSPSAELERINREIANALADARHGSDYYADEVRRSKGTDDRLRKIDSRVRKLGPEWRSRVVGLEALLKRAVFLRKLMQGTPRGRATLQRRKKKITIRYGVPTVIKGRVVA
jgi:hypothetical protein